MGSVGGAVLAGKINQIAADEIKKFVNIVLTQARGIYNLGPVAALIDANVSLSQVSDWARQGRRLRLAVVGLELGEIGYVTESGELLDYDQNRVRARNIRLQDGALASASIAGVFTPVPFANEWWVDGGHREILPVRAAVQLGATEVYAISCSPIDRYSAVNRTPRGLERPDFTNKTLLDIVQRALVEIHPDEINADDLAPHVGWGVPLRTIMPVFPVHDMLTIHPALIRISYAYGYMRAADVHRQVQPRVESLASEITIKRLETILRRETLILPNLGTPLFDTEAEVEDLRRLKRELRELVHQRIVFGGVVPSDVHEWYTSWEEHRDRTALSLNQEYQLGIYSRPLEVAFQANTGNLWTVGVDNHGDWGLGMMAGTSPSMAR